MALATLRHYLVSRSTTGTDVLVTVPASRALVISKILIATNTSAVVTVAVAGTIIAANLSLTAGGIYTENGLVLLAGETCTVQVTSMGTGSVSSHVFGEEVDN